MWHVSAVAAKQKGAVRGVIVAAACAHTLEPSAVVMGLPLTTRRPTDVFNNAQVSHLYLEIEHSESTRQYAHPSR